MILASFTQLLIQVAQPNWTILLALLAQIIALRLLRQTGTQFAEVTAGHKPFDLQNRLTGPEIDSQLVDYSTSSRSLYTRFFVIDFFFPLAASCFIALLWAALLQHQNLDLSRQLLAWNAPVWAFVPALFDWGENVCFLILIRSYPPANQNLVRLGLSFKRLKLGALTATVIITLILLAMSGVLLLQQIR